MERRDEEEDEWLVCGCWGVASAGEISSKAIDSIEFGCDEFLLGNRNADFLVELAVADVLETDVGEDEPLLRSSLFR